jgi:hypothetical protein
MKGVFLLHINSGMHTETGVYRILAASSSQDVRLDAELAITSDQIADVPDYRLKAPAYYSLGNYGHGIPKEQFEAVFGSRIEDPVIPHKGVFDLNSTYRSKHNMGRPYDEKTDQQRNG